MLCDRGRTNRGQIDEAGHHLVCDSGPCPDRRR